jgi:hypothetical protein
VKKKTLLSALAGLGLLALLGGCSTDSGTGAPGLGRVNIRLTDAPGDFEQVNLVITGVSIHRGDETSGAWETMQFETATFDLLELRNGVFTNLATALVPAGQYTQVRLLLGEGSNVVVDGVTHPLKVPSGMQSGYKIIGDFEVPSGGQVDLTLDFDAARSIVVTGSDNYLLKPTVRMIVNAVVTTGQIIGRVLPAGVSVAIYAIQGTDTLQTTAPDAAGAFTLAALLAGSYDVAIHPAADYRDTTIAGVAVTAGQSTDLGDIQLTPTGSTSSAPVVGAP